MLAAQLVGRRRARSACASPVEPTRSVIRIVTVSTELIRQHPVSPGLRRSYPRFPRQSSRNAVLRVLARALSAKRLWSGRAAGTRWSSESRELHRVIRPGGRLVVGEIAPLDPHFVRFAVLGRRAAAAKFVARTPPAPVGRQQFRRGALRDRPGGAVRVGRGPERDRALAVGALSDPARARRAGARAAPGHAGDRARARPGAGDLPAAAAVRGRLLLGPARAAQRPARDLA